MRRLQIYLSETLDDALGEEAVRRGTSKSALIRHALTRDLGSPRADDIDAWSALDGWLADGGLDDIDSEIYDPG